MKSINTKYWADYNEGTSIQGSPAKFSEKSTNFEDTFTIAIWDWNIEAEKENTLEDTQIEEIKELATEFFNEEKWISVNVIHAMISQEC
jgi:hypothetical protein